MTRPPSPVRFVLGLVIALMLIFLEVARRADTAVWAPFLIVLGTILAVAALVRRAG